MNTHGLIGFRIDGEKKGFLNYKYSCPRGLGTRILEFLFDNILYNEENCLTMVERMRALTWVSEYSAPTEQLQDRYLDYAGTENRHARFNTSIWRHLLYTPRNGVCLREILAGRLAHLVDDTGLFTAQTKGNYWAYFLDFEHERLEIWSNGIELYNVGFKDLRWSSMAIVDDLHCMQDHGEFEATVRVRDSCSPFGGMQDEAEERYDDEIELQESGVEDISETIDGIKQLRIKDGEPKKGKSLFLSNEDLDDIADGRRWGARG